MAEIQILDAVLDFIEQEQQHFIDGKWQASSATERHKIYNPATGEVLTTAAVGTLADLNSAVEVAHRSFVEQRWSGLRPADRERILYRYAELLLENQEILAQLETLNQGKSIHLARAIDVGATAEYIRYMAGWATKITGETMDVSIAAPAGAKHTAYTKRQPVGVVGAIAPWNFPLLIAMWKTIPALVVGCSVVLKPATETPLTALYMAKLALEAGIPAGVFNVVTGSGGVIGQALVEHPLVRKVTFTGSTAVGKQIGHAAIEKLIDVSLELGGKNPMLILADCPVEKAINGILMGGFLNSGQVCAAASRIYIHQSIFQAVVDGVHNIVKELSLGSGLDEAAQLQPLVSEKQQTAVLNYIEIAKQEGCRIICGGNKPNRAGYFVEPTIITHAAPDGTIIKEEIFGPVVTMVPFINDEDAIKLANDSVYGLAASLWTNDLTKVMNYSAEIEAGTVWVNTHIPLDPSMPFGGFKESGIGREFGKASVESFTEVKSICIAH